MFFLNLIIAIIVIIYQLYNNITLNTALRKANTFLFANTKTNPETKKVVRDFKIKLLQVNRIILIAALFAAILLIIFNKTLVITVIYILVFLLLPFLYDRYYIDKSIKTLKKDNHLEDNQDVSPVFLDLVYNDKDGDHFYEYSLRRYMINIGTIVGKLFIVVLIALITVFIALIILFTKPSNNEIEINANVTSTSFVIEYDKSETSIQFSDIASIEKKPTLPKLEGDVKGVEDGDYLLGSFSTKDYGEVRMFVYKNSPTFLLIRTVNNKYYVFSEENQADSNTIYEKIKENIPSDEPIE